MEDRKEEPMFRVADIVARARTALGCRTDSELAARLGVSRSTLSNWCARNSIDFPLLLGALKEVDYTWLLTGRGTPAKSGNFCDSRLAEGEVEVIHNPKTAEPVDDRMVPLYDISAAANLHTLLDPRPQSVLGTICIPGVPRCDGAVYVSGDSMYPLLKSGDIVGYRLIHDIHDAVFGEMYLVSFRLQHEDYLAVKYLNRSERPGYVRLVSYNRCHEPQELPVENIQALALVKFSIRKDLIC